jgi:hypothetical protein
MIDDVEMMDIIDDIDLEEIFTPENSHIENKIEDAVYMLGEVIRIKRENKLLTKRVKLLETLAKSRNNFKSCYNFENHVEMIQRKTTLLENLGVSFETNRVTVYTIDPNIRKEKKKNRRKININ